MKQLPEEHRRNWLIRACKIDVVCRNKQASSPLIHHVVLDFSGELNYRSALKTRVWVECIRGRVVLIEFERTHRHTKREGETTGECLLSCGNKAEADKTASFFLLPQSLFLSLSFYLSSHVSFSLCLPYFSASDKSFFSRNVCSSLSSSMSYPCGSPCFSLFSSQLSLS